MSSASQTSTFLVLATQALDQRVEEALQSAAQALGYADGCAAMQIGEPAALAQAICEADPWVVVAIDDASIKALRNAFPEQLPQLAPDKPAAAMGYRFIAVPDFAGSLDELDKKRVAWKRLKAARHPGNPLQ